MPSRARSIVAAVAASAAAVALVPAPPAGAALPGCALGRASAGDRGVFARVVHRQRERFVASLGDIRKETARRAGDDFAAGVAAYVYGFPTVMLQRTVATFPRNGIVAIAELATPATQTIVAPNHDTPNHDTLYSVARLDLRDGPLVIHTPPTGGRYSVLQLLDAYTNDFAYLGDRAGARTGTTVALVPPGWRGALRAGVRRLRSPTPTVWLLGRTLVDDRADVAAARRLLARYSLTPLAAWSAGVRRPPLVLAAFPRDRKPVRPPRGLGFFDELGVDLASDPPPRHDACALRAFAGAGVGPGRRPSRARRGVTRRALAAAASSGPRAIGALVAHVRSRAVRGWSPTPSNTGRYGTDYAARAVVARIGLGANTPERALYPSTNRDARGRPLSGRHVYDVRFERGQLPPVRRFWSLTLYDERILLYANPLRRYALVDRTSGLRRARDGSLVIRVSHRPPPRRLRSNWLPSPRGRFWLYLRLYEPGRGAIAGRWPPPLVRRIR